MAVLGFAGGRSREESTQREATTRGTLTMAAWTAPSHWRTRPAQTQGGCLIRTLRRAGLVTAILMLLGGSAGAVVAQEGDQNAEAAYFGGSSGVPEIVTPPEVTTTPEGVMQIRGVSGVQANTMDDPRFSGTETWIMNEDHYGDVVGPAWGTSHIENEDGSWSGTFRGILLPDGSATYFGTYVGEGGYEGLSVACVTSTDGISGFGGDCVLYPGAVPDLTSE